MPATCVREHDHFARRHSRSPRRGSRSARGTWATMPLCRRKRAFIPSPLCGFVLAVSVFAAASVSALTVYPAGDAAVLAGATQVSFTLYCTPVCVCLLRVRAWLCVARPAECRRAVSFV